MSYRVEAGHRVNVNGRQYLPGQVLPDLGSAVFLSLENSGLIVNDEPKPEIKREKRREQKAEDAE